MPNLRIQQPNDDATFEDWQLVHNAIIPSDPLTLEEIRERAQHNLLEVAYLDTTLIGCTTVRPLTPDSTITLIVRVLPAHRRQGHGQALYIRALSQAGSQGATHLETIILASNTDGLTFAHSHGFTESETYLPPGDTVPFITLRRETPTS